MSPVHADSFAELRRAMVEEQLRRRGIKDKRVLEAMTEVPRHLFVPPGQYDEAYDDRALPIGQGQTISQPYMVGLMVSLLDVQPEHKVLEVGAGSGYQAAVLSRLAESVCAVELVPQLAERAARILADLHYDNVRIMTGDGTVGCAEEAPFDRIIVAAAAPEIPEPLTEQLAEGGVIVAPVGNRLVQTVVRAEKRGSKLNTTRSIDCVFVPLRGRHGWND